MTFCWCNQCGETFVGFCRVNKPKTYCKLLSEVSLQTNLELEGTCYTLNYAVNKTSVESTKPSSFEVEILSTTPVSDEQTKQKLLKILEKSLKDQQKLSYTESLEHEVWLQTND